MLRWVAIVSFVATWSHAMEKEQLQFAIYKSCKYEDKVCPKNDFSIIDSNGNWTWDWNAVVATKQFQRWKNMTLNTNLLAVMTRAYFCCTSGPCLRNCINAELPVEDELIQNFPGNADELFSLNYEPLETHREFVTGWVQNYHRGLEKDREYPSEIEDFFDTLAVHKDKIKKLLEMKHLKDQLEAQKLMS